MFFLVHFPAFLYFKMPRKWNDQFYNLSTLGSSAKSGKTSWQQLAPDLTDLSHIKLNNFRVSSIYYRRAIISHSLYILYFIYLKGFFVKFCQYIWSVFNTLGSGIKVAPWINVAPGKFGKKNKRSPIYTLYLHS